MVRTGATTVRASGGKSSKAARTSNIPKNVFSSSSSDRNTIGGNPVCPRETPTWQKPITNFFTKQPEAASDTNIIETEPTEMIVEEVTEMEFLGEGCSTMHITENRENYDKSTNKENILAGDKLEDKHGGENLTENKENAEDEKIPTKRQKLDFYKHLEEIENM